MQSQTTYCTYLFSLEDLDEKESAQSEAEKL